MARIANALAKGLPYAFRKPVRRSSRPGAFHEAMRLSVAWIMDLFSKANLPRFYDEVA